MDITGDVFINLDLTKNPAQNFGKIVRYLKILSKEEGVPQTKMLSDFVADLQHYNEEGYENKVEFVDIMFKTEVDPSVIKSLMGYVRKEMKSCLQNESKHEKKEKKESRKMEMESKWGEIIAYINELASSGKEGSKIEIIQKVIEDIQSEKYDFTSKEKKYIMKKLEGELSMAESERDAMIHQKHALEEAMKQLEGIVEREYNLGHIENKGNFWESIEKVINGTNRDERINIKIDENIKNELLDRIGEKVTIEKQQLYYEQVRRFTNDFSFLSEYSEVAKARGVQFKKFTDAESYRRFLGLQSLVHGGADEYTQIVSLLERDDVEEVNRRILEARKCVIDKEMNIQSTEISR